MVTVADLSQSSPPPLQKVHGAVRLWQPRATPLDRGGQGEGGRDTVGGGKWTTVELDGTVTGELSMVMLFG